MSAASIWSWVMLHDWQVLTIAIYILLNVGPRPHPESLTGYKRIFWLLVDRLAVLSAEKVPGNWKWFLQPSPLPLSLTQPAPRPVADPTSDAVTLSGNKEEPPSPPPAA